MIYSPPTSTFRITLPTELIRYLNEKNNFEHSIADICARMICNVVGEMIAEDQKKADENCKGMKARRSWV